MKKILLVPSPVINKYYLEFYIHYGLCSLQAVSSKYGPEVDILQISKDVLNKKIRSLQHLTDILLGPVDLSDYDTIGLSTTSIGFHHTLNIIHSIKEREPDMKIWLGGPYVSVIAEKVLRVFKDIDAVFIGESESTFAEVMSRRSKNNPDLDNIDGIMTRRYGFVPREPIADLDDLPDICRSKQYIEDVIRDRQAQFTIHGQSNEAPLETTRGCPGNCSFCSTSSYWGKKIRWKSDDRIVSEMKKISELTGTKDFCFIGDNFGFPKKRLQQFCRKMIAEDVGFKWNCSLRINDLKPEDLDLLRDAGCHRFFTGIESVSPETLKKIHKKVDLDQAKEVIIQAIDKGFEVNTSFIIGFPWETRKDIDDTYMMHHDLLKAGVARSDINILIPLSGTSLINQHNIIFNHGPRAQHYWLDSIPIDENMQRLIEQNPDIFLYMGYFETPGVDRKDVLAINKLARDVRRLY